MMKIAKRSENMFLKYLGWNRVFVNSLAAVHGRCKSDDEVKLDKVSGFISLRGHDEMDYGTRNGGSTPMRT